MEFVHAGANILGQLVDIFLVGLGEDELSDALARRCHRLLLDTADGEHLAVQTNLASHAKVLRNGLLEGQREQGRGDRDTGRGPIFRRRPLREVDVDVLLLQEAHGPHLLLIAELVAIVIHQEVSGICQRNRRALLHHRA